MKLLGWMHRKFRQNSGEPYRDSNTGYGNCLSGRPSLEESQVAYYGHQKPSRFPPRASHDRFFFPEELADEEVNPHAVDELFHGLLAIGTLGSLGEVNEEDYPAAGDATPTFGVSALPMIVSVDAIAEKEDGCEATEDDLMIINAELEKVLLLPEDKSDRLSSARASQVSAKQLVLTSCPLQEYLFGSLVDAAETTTVAAVATQEKREHHRTSLGELFMRSRMVEEGGNKKLDREKSTAGMHLMVKKMLKRRGGSSGNAGRHDSAFAADGSSGHTANSETKFHKILQMFHRKVHPENSVAAKKAAKASRCWNKASAGGRGNTGLSGKSVPVAGVTRNLEADQQGAAARSEELASADIAAAGGGGCGDSSGNREHWIKTDADYLVLEL